ncbi:MAG TPA: aspartate aminotransferase family protein [Paraburkholderia sp.]|uniref:aspartate aminotransferase family protein n=1 Tax=Paraburkholderia sp. TaxID=1926495 RepID=UPI002B45E5FA|nr:aspartate aminotransferase family protein [Paraburkholderia sp.]HKR40433.1 aspartate aminotransferase family protein [Paraburkholderia sp.]
MGPNAPLLYDSPLYLTHGTGVWLFDDAGRRYLDAYNNVPHVGHSHPAIAAAVAKQIGLLNTHSRYLSKPVLDYHEQLLSTFDLQDPRVVLTCTGSESNELALRMARFVTGNVGVIVTDYTYHGNTAAVAEASTAFHANPAGLPNHIRTIRAPAAGILRDSTGSPLSNEAAKEAYLLDVRAAIDHFHAHDIGVAAILLDTIFSTDGLPNVVPDFVREAVGLVRRAGGLYIADEVQPGLGRCGETWWGYQMHGVLPDIVTLGKPLGNGYPIAGVVARSDVISDFRKSVMYFNTFGAAPVACAAGSAVLEVIENENLIDNARQVGTLLRQRLTALSGSHKCIGEVRGKGLFVGVEIVKEGNPLAPDAATAKKLVENMRNAGVLISKIGKFDNVLKIRPPMPFSAENVDQLASTMDEALLRIAKGN